MSSRRVPAYRNFDALCGVIRSRITERSARRWQVATIYREYVWRS